ncbi:MAG: haloacid dehalogenase, partial [Metallosphaera sp.]
MITDKINEYISSVEEKLMSRFESRERLLQISREVIRYSGETISLSHRGRRDEALEKYGQARKRVEEIKNIVQNFPELLFGDVGVVFQEISEASVVLSFYFNLPLN